MSCSILSAIRHNVVLYGKLLKRERERGAFDVACNELLAFFLKEGVTHPYAKAGVVLRENVHHVIVS